MLISSFRCFCPFPSKGKTFVDFSLSSFINFLRGAPLCRIACRILIPRAGIELVPSTVEALSLNHWITMEALPLTLYFHKVGNVKAHVNMYVWNHQELASLRQQYSQVHFLLVSFQFSFLFCFVLGKQQRHFASPCTISKASARIFGEKLGLRERWGPICIHLSRTFPGLVMGPHVWRTLHTGLAASTWRTFALHLLMWAIFPRETFFLILRSFIYAGVSSTSSCCIRELIIFLSRYYFLPACFCQQSMETAVCPQRKDCFSSVDHT